VAIFEAADVFDGDARAVGQLFLSHVASSSQADEVLAEFDLYDFGHDSALPDGSALEHVVYDNMITKVLLQFQLGGGGNGEGFYFLLIF
jgi:hypothetical protein